MATELPYMLLSEIRTAAKQRADMVNASFVSDAEWNSYINQSYFELYDVLVQAYGEDYFVTTNTSIVTDGLTDLFNLPVSGSPSQQVVYKLLGVDVQVAGTAGAANGTYLPLRKFTFAERNMPGIASAPRAQMRYRLNGNKLWLTPLPAAGQTIRLWYVPRLAYLSSDASIADGVSGWLEYVICDAAIKALQKEESDVSVLFAQKQALLARIQAAAVNRDAGEAPVTADVGAFGLRFEEEWT